MNSEDNSISSPMELDIIKELYKKTPLKKRPIQPSSLSLDEKKIPPKPRVMLKPTKKLIDSYVESTEVVEPPPKAMYVPVIKTSSEAKDSSPVEIDNNAVSLAMAMAIPELKTACVETEVPSRIYRSSKALCKKNFTKQEWEDFKLAVELQKEEFNLRVRRPRKSTSNSRIKSKSERSSRKKKGTSEESVDIDSILMQEKPNEGLEKQAKQESKAKRTPKQTSVNIGEGQKVASTCLFTGNHSQNMYLLSPELANIVGHQKMSSGAIVDAMHYVFLERNLFEPDKKYVICDDELSEKLFGGKRRLRFDDVKNYLHKHLTLTD